MLSQASSRGEIMKKILVFILLLNFCQTVQAQQIIWDTIDAINKRVFGTPSCTDCVKGHVEAGGFWDVSKSKGTQLPATCQSYISKAGALGVKGKMMRSLMGNNLAFQKTTRDMGSLCPNFSNLSKDQKLNFWVWLWGALAFDESTCGQNTRAAGVNGVAVGEFQMEGSLALRKQGNRPRACMTSNIAAFGNNASCAVAIMSKQIGNKSQIFGRPNYWAKLLSRGGKVFNLAKSYPGCR